MSGSTLWRKTDRLSLVYHICLSKDPRLLYSPTTFPSARHIPPYIPYLHQQKRSRLLHRPESPSVAPIIAATHIPYLHQQIALVPIRATSCCTSHSPHTCDTCMSRNVPSFMPTRAIFSGVRQIGSHLHIDTSKQIRQVFSGFQPTFLGLSHFLAYMYSCMSQNFHQSP